MNYIKGCLISYIRDHPLIMDSPATYDPASLQPEPAGLVVPADMYRLFMQAPAAIALLEGPQHRYTFANALYQKIFNRTEAELLGRTPQEVFSEIAGQGIYELFDAVYQSQTPFVAAEFPASFEDNGTSRTGYYNFVIQPILDERGASSTLMVHAYEVTAQVLARRRTEESEAKYRSIFQSAGVSIWEEDFTAVKEVIDALKAGGVTDVGAYCRAHPEFVELCMRLVRITDVNDATLRMFEADDKAQLLDNLGTVFLPETMPVFIGELVALAEGHLLFESECRLRTLKGNLLYVLFAMKLPEPGQCCDSVLFTLIDITARKAAEERLKASEVRFRNILEQTPEPVLVLKGPELIVEVANEPLFRTWRMDDRVLGKPLLECLPELRGQGIVEMMLDVYQNRRVIKGYDRPVIYDRGHGAIETRYYNFVYSPYVEANGTVSGILVMGTDVTGSVQARQALEESESRFRTLATTIPQVVWTTDDTGRLDYLSDQWERYTGQPVPEGLTESNRMIHPDDIGQLADRWRTSLQTGVEWKMDYRIWHQPSGSYRWFTGQTAPLKDTDGRILRWIGTATDIHEQKLFTEKLEALVAERTRALQRSNEDLQQFAHVASHDLKEPVRKVKTFIGRLEQHLGQELDDTAARYVQRIDSAANRMSAMIDGVLRYSTLNAATEDFQQVDLMELLRSIEADLEVAIQAKEARVLYDSLPVIEGAPLLVYQVLYNLVNNSIKFSREGEPPLIQIRSEVISFGGYPFVQIQLSDNGIGFDNAQAEAIFQNFTRLHPKDRYEGTGLGLALCRKIVERHGGRIWAKGRPGQGASFTIMLPVRQTDATLPVSDSKYD